MRRCNYQWVGRHDLLCLFFLPFVTRLRDHFSTSDLRLDYREAESLSVFVNERGKPINFQTIAERQNRFATFLQDRNCTSVLLTSNFCFWNLFFEFYSYFSLSFFLLFAKIINHEARKRYVSLFTAFFIILRSEETKLYQVYEIYSFRSHSKFARICQYRSNKYRAITLNGSRYEFNETSTRLIGY